MPKLKMLKIFIPIMCFLYLFNLVYYIPYLTHKQEKPLLSMNLKKILKV